MKQLFSWQQKSWVSLQKQRQRLPHALLLVGPEGIGKANFAGVLAASLLCDQPQSNGLPCQHCQACRLLNANHHPDQILLAPEKAGQAIKVDAIRQLVTFNALSCHGKQAKIAIIEPAEAMNNAACNALLKILEEPNENRYLLLISQHPHHLPATIRSRCQFLHFSVPTRTEAEDWLTQQSVSPPPLLLDLAAGAPLKALTLQHTDFIAIRSQLFNQWQHFSQGRLSLIGISEALEKLDLSLFLWHLKSWVHDLIRLQLVPSTTHLTNRDLVQILKKWAPQCQINKLFELLDEIQSTEKSLMNKIALNKRLIIEGLLIVWQNMLKERNHAS